MLTGLPVARVTMFPIKFALLFLRQFQNISIIIKDVTHSAICLNKTREFKVQPFLKLVLADPGLIAQTLLREP